MDAATIKRMAENLADEVRNAQEKVQKKRASRQIANQLNLLIDEARKICPPELQRMLPDRIAILPEGDWDDILGIAVKARYIDIGIAAGQIAAVLEGLVK